MNFEYRARDPLGATLSGVISASAEEDARQQLRQDGFHVLDLNEVEEVESLFPKRVSRASIIYVTSQLAVMVETGITLSAALDGIQINEENPTLKKILMELKEAVESGEDFSKALEQYPHLFDKTYVSLVRASEATGSMGEMLDRIADYLRKDAETRAKVRAAMAYPTIMFLVATGVTIFLLTYVLPKFTPLFSRRGIDLPKPTIVMMELSYWLTEYWIGWIALSITLALTFVFGRKTPRGRVIWDAVRLRIPLVGAMTKKVVISRSIRTLGAMLTGGVPMLDALRLSADVAGNIYYERMWQRVHDEVTTGQQVHQSLSGDPLFPPMLVQMISAGEQTGHLGKVLQKISDYYDREVETSLKTVTSMIEPLMITVMGVVVGGIGMALLLPIFTLSKTPG